MTTFEEGQTSYVKYREWTRTGDNVSPDHKSEPASSWFNWRGFCGCGDNEIVLALMRDAMVYLRDYWKRVRADDSPPQSAYAMGEFREITQEEARWMLMYLLDHTLMAEHGSSVRGNWPTTDGEAWLADIEKELK